jgi:transcriptional regulator with XRE-family HTH domain
MTADVDALMRLGTYVERRIAELGLEYAAVCRVGGFSDETLSKIRKGAINARAATYRKLERALLWSHGSVEMILSGGEPVPLPADTADNESGDPALEQRGVGAAAEEAPSPPGLSPGEALRRVVRASARELGVRGEDLDEVFQAVRDDLEEAPPSGRTDLSDLVRVRRATAGLSLEAVAAATATGSGERLIEVDWLDRLERAALSPDEYPEYPQLDALANVLDLDPGDVQEAAGAQFMDVHTVWSEDGQVRAVVTGELNAEDLAKVQKLMRLYRQAPRR